LTVKHRTTHILKNDDIDVQYNFIKMDDYVEVKRMEYHSMTKRIFERECKETFEDARELYKRLLNRGYIKL